ncbi:ABC transporter permease [Glycomyces mayteni]|uniref:ABC transporter permease n=1 Tax=Glycomyces mayteni TaxID=543887 RepID=A0ABW2D4F0_9ACTN|nr:ABC-2 family transporter protein [Glycomyces mayteni]
MKPSSALRPDSLLRRAAFGLALAAASFKRQTVYRVNWLSGLLASSLALMVGFAVWSELIGDGELGGYDWSSMQAYLMICFVTSTLAWSGTEELIANRILDGDIAIDLTKPVDFQRTRAAEFFGSVAAAVPAGALGCAAVWLVFRPAPPESATAAALACLSLVMLVPLVFGVNYMGILVCFWTRRYMSFKWAQDTLVTFMSGMMMPLSLMPHWLETLAWCLPFVHYAAAPAAIYLGRVDHAEAIGLLLAEALWTVVLWGTGRLLWRHQIKQVTVHGG